MTAPQVQNETTYAVLLGNFNPRIIEPLWLAKQGLVAEEEAERAERQLIDAEMSRIVFPWAELIVLQNQVQVESGPEMVSDSQLRDLAVGMLRLLPHTPVQVVSIQHRVTVIAASEDQWHNVGHAIAPKEIWEDVLEKPGILDFAMQGTRPDDHEGSIKVRIRPLPDPKWAVWINVNDELGVPAPDARNRGDARPSCSNRFGRRLSPERTPSVVSSTSACSREMAVAPATSSAVEDTPTLVRPLVAVDGKPIPGLRLFEPGSSEGGTDEARPVKIGRATVVNPQQEIERQGATPAVTLEPLQKWEGAVLEVGEATFVARLVDLTGDRPEEEIELEKAELSDFDLDLLEPGAVFYWSVGYRRQLPRGARSRESVIRFRRLPAWSRAELEAARERAEEARRDLGW
jgi:hypothetical protein